MSYSNILPDPCNQLIIISDYVNIIGLPKPFDIKQEFKELRQILTQQTHGFLKPYVNNENLETVVFTFNKEKTFSDGCGYLSYNNVDFNPYSYITQFTNIGEDSAGILLKNYHSYDFEIEVITNQPSSSFNFIGQKAVYGPYVERMVDSSGNYTQNRLKFTLRNTVTHIAIRPSLDFDLEKANLLVKVTPIRVDWDLLFNSNIHIISKINCKCYNFPVVKYKKIIKDDSITFEMYIYPEFIALSLMLQYLFSCLPVDY